MLSELEAAYIQGEEGSAKLILDSKAADNRAGWFVQRGKPIKSCKPDGCDTMLGFLIHDLDTGNTDVMEEAWDEYVRESHSTSVPEPIAALAAKSSGLSSSRYIPKRSCSKSVNS